MVRRELIAALARNHKELKVKDVDLMVRLLFETMGETLVEGGEIELRGFGSFRQRRYAARQARNPSTGQSLEVGQRRGLAFRVGQKLRERLNDE